MNSERIEWIAALATTYGVSIEQVRMAAELLGESEDCDALVSTVQDMAEYHLLDEQMPDVLDSSEIDQLEYDLADLKRIANAIETGDIKAAQALLEKAIMEIEFSITINSDDTQH